MTKGPVHEKRCKVCNSQFRNIIEQLYVQGYKAEKIYEYLRSLGDPEEATIVLEEDLRAGGIRRHLDNHFNVNDVSKFKMATTRSKLQKSRELFEQGITKVVNNVDTLTHMIEMAMIKLEEIDDQVEGKNKYQLTLSYMNTIKGLIESLAKLTGDLRQEGTIDINFFNFEIKEFANIVLLSVKELDELKEMGGILELEFAQIFKRRYDAFKEKQERILNGEITVDQADEYKNVNLFNETTITE